MSFSYDVSTDLGKVRLYVHDNTDGVYQVDYDFSDADVLAILEQEGDSIWLSAAACCRILAVKATPTAYLLRIPGAIELDKKQVAKIYNGLADALERRATTGPDTIVEYVDS